jgi:hypothetical protein
LRRADDPQVRLVLNQAILATVGAYGFRGRVVAPPEGDEIEVLCAPKIPVPGARFFLRVEKERLPKKGDTGKVHHAVVSTRLLASWRIVPEPVAVVGVDPWTGAGRVGEAHPVIAALDKRNRGWTKEKTVAFPLDEPLDGGTIPRLARKAADAHVMFRRVVDHIRRMSREAAPADLAASVARLREIDFDYTLACLDLMRSEGLLEETAERELRPTASCLGTFAQAAVHHGLGARAHRDPATAGETGRSAVVRLLMSRLPDTNESTVERCAIVLARFLPVDDADGIVELAKNPDAMGEAIAGEE